MMDIFNFIVSTFLMFMALQMGSDGYWIALGVLVISIITSKDLSTIVAFLIATGIMYYVIGTGDDSILLIGIFAIIVVAILLGSKAEQPQQPDMGGLGGYGDMFGGMGGGY